jgi:hypothetical protein
MTLALMPQYMGTSVCADSLSARDAGIIQAKYTLLRVKHLRS